jgi:hypothetical protein
MAHVRVAALIAGLTAVGAAASSGTAFAADYAPQAQQGAALGARQPDAGAALNGLAGSTRHVLGPILDMRLDPWAASSADPLTNGVEVRPDSPGMRPVSTLPLTAPLSAGGGLSSLLGH